MNSSTSGVSSFVVLWCIGGGVLLALSGQFTGLLFVVAAIVVFPLFASFVEEQRQEIEEGIEE